MSPERFQDSFPSFSVYAGVFELGKQPFVHEQKLLPAQFWGQLSRALWDEVSREQKDHFVPFSTSAKTLLLHK